MTFCNACNSTCCLCERRCHDASVKEVLRSLKTRKNHRRSCSFQWLADDAKRHCRQEKCRSKK